MKLNQQCIVKASRGNRRCQNRAPDGFRKCTNCAKNRRKFLPNKPRNKRSREDRKANTDKVPELLAENPHCGHCGRKITKAQIPDAECGHWMPAAEGGKDDWSNFMAVHHDCNRAVSGKLPWAEDMEDSLAGIKRFSKNGESKGRKLTTEQEEEVCFRYLAKESTNELGEDFGVDSGTVSRILKRKGHKVRSSKEAHGGPTDEEEEEICRRYLEGENQRELEEAFGVSQSTISNILKRKEVKTRPGGHDRLTYEQEEEVCRRYLEGESGPRLGKAFGVHARTIGRIIKRNGMKMRSISKARKLFYRQRKSKSK